MTNPVLPRTGVTNYPGQVKDTNPDTVWKFYNYQVFALLVQTNGPHSMSGYIKDDLHNWARPKANTSKIELRLIQNTTNESLTSTANVAKE